MTKVYLVSSGSYSDYEIVGVFSTREKALEYIETVGGPKDESWSDVNREPVEMEIDAPRSTWPDACWNVVIDAAGEIVRTAWVNDRPTRMAWHAPEYSVGGMGLKVDAFFGYGETKEHARRSAEELRRRTLAIPPNPAALLD